MHLLTNIDHLLTIDGVVAVTIATPGGQAFRGVEPWAPRLAAVIAVFALCDEPTMIVRIGEHTAHVQREGDQVAAVVIPTGHAIAKSLRRHIRRAAKSAPTRLPTREAEARADALAQHLDEGRRPKELLTMQDQTLSDRLRAAARDRDFAGALWGPACERLAHPDPDGRGRAGGRPSRPSMRRPRTPRRRPRAGRSWPSWRTRA
jgi:hypothetical protein